ncbi:MAG: hypothetical protein ACK5HS_01450 [Mycoplasmatales bacterium]
MLNNKGYLLFDSLVSLLILTSTTMFFLQMININNKHYMYLESKDQALNNIQVCIYNTALDKPCINNVYYKEEHICSTYQKEGIDNEVCI